MSNKVCTTCYEDKPLNDFPNNRNTKDGKAYMCKACMRHRYAYDRDKTATERDATAEAGYIAKMLRSAKARAEEKGLEFSLTDEDITIPAVCPVLHTKLESTGDRTTSPSIDRIDNTKGYTPDNIVIVSFRANSLKSDATIKELVWLAEFYRDAALDREKALKGEKVVDSQSYNTYNV